jgi:hypothetical protein
MTAVSGAARSLSLVEAERFLKMGGRHATFAGIACGSAAARRAGASVEDGHFLVYTSPTVPREGSAFETRSLPIELSRGRGAVFAK